jgi:hypothetical protein
VLSSEFCRTFLWPVTVCVFVARLFMPTTSLPIGFAWIWSVVTTGAFGGR